MITDIIITAVITANFMGYPLFSIKPVLVMMLVMKTWIKNPPPTAGHGPCPFFFYELLTRAVSTLLFIIIRYVYVQIIT